MWRWSSAVVALASAAVVVACGDGAPAGADAGRADAAVVAVDGGVDAAVADAAPPPRAFDVDSDGVADTDLAVVVCAADPTATCLRVESSVVAARDIPLAATRPECTGVIAGRLVGLIGDYDGDGNAEAGVAYCRNDGVRAPPALAIVDLAAGEAAAQTVAPAAHTNAFVDHPADPTGKRHPFLAPSYGDGGFGADDWGALCLYRPALASDAACGPGFVAASATPSTGAYFREVGGYLQDLDGDGWEDVTLIYHQLVYSVSTATAAALGELTFDVAATTEPAAPAWFHSGRNYGTHAAIDAGGGTLRAVVVGGAPVGSFADYNCNVSRFLAVLEAPAGAPASRRLAWSKYYGFASTSFSVFSDSFADDPTPAISRPADVMNGCVHRFSDSRAVIDGEPAIVVNYFLQAAPVDVCLQEQYALYLPPQWTPEKADAWYGCFAENVAAQGVWGMQAVREADGAGITGSLDTYVWGRSSRLLPSGELVYLVESLPGAGRFDLGDRAPSALSVYALVDGLWSARGAFPVPGRPLLRAEPASGARGVGSYTYFAELTLGDRDGDGLMEVALDGGEWVEYSQASGAFELVP